MQKEVMLRHGAILYIRDDMRVSKDEICYFELNDGSYHIAPYFSMIGRPHKKVWKIMLEDTTSIKYKMKVFIHTIIWGFVNIFMKKQLIKQNFEISIGLRDTKNSFHRFSPKKNS